MTGTFKLKYSHRSIVANMHVFAEKKREKKKNTLAVLANIILLRILGIFSAFRQMKALRLVMKVGVVDV